MKKILIGMIRFYQKYLSGLKTTYHCIYTPTCSQYGIEAIEKYGAVKGLALTVWRILGAIHLQKADMIRYLKEDKRWNLV